MEDIYKKRPVELFERFFRTLLIVYVSQSGFRHP